MLWRSLVVEVLQKSHCQTICTGADAVLTDQKPDYFSSKAVATVVDASCDNHWTQTHLHLSSVTTYGSHTDIT